MSTEMSTRIAAGVTAAYLHELARHSARDGGEPARTGAGMSVRAPVHAVVGASGGAQLPQARRHRDHLAADPAAFGAGEEGDRARDLRGGRAPLQPARDGIHGDVARAELAGQHARQRLDRRLARRVRGVGGRGHEHGGAR
jgi:hypothetical protein